MADVLNWCGYKGWVILIDEVELIGRLGKVGRLDAYQNLNWLLNWSSNMFYPIYTVGVVALSLRNDVWFSSDRTHIPELAAQKFGEDATAEMKIFFDIAISRQCPTIEPLSQDELSKLLASLVECHRIAYDWDAQLDIPSLIQYMGAQPVRTHIRAALEALDINYTYKETIIPEVINLVEGSVKEDRFFKESEA